jgi:hypothetical protein
VAVVPVARDRLEWVRLAALAVSVRLGLMASPVPVAVAVVEPRAGLRLTEEVPVRGHRIHPQAAPRIRVVAVERKVLRRFSVQGLAVLASSSLRYREAKDGTLR